MEILRVQNLCKTYGKGEAKVDALKNVSFSLEKGEFAAVVGESGSGKSTLLNCIGALDLPTSGTILMDGQNLFSMKEEERTIFRRRNIGFIFQSFQLVSELNVEQNIMFPLLLDYRKPDSAAVKEILELLGLTERRRHLPNQLSGGQQQRVAIGRALITKPKLILADEPTGNLDSKNSQDVMDLLTQASRRYQQTILMITHNKNLTASVDRVFRVTDGVLTDLGGVCRHYDDRKQPEQQCCPADRVFRIDALYRGNTQTGYAFSAERSSQLVPLCNSCGRFKRYGRNMDLMLDPPAP